MPLLRNNNIFIVLTYFLIFQDIVICMATKLRFTFRKNQQPELMTSK
jgi:hypothetical protein